MKRLGVLMATAALSAALVASGPAEARFGGGGFRGGGFGGWHGGWAHGGWGRGGWGRGGWGGGWGWGLAGLGLGTGLGLGLAGLDYGGGYPYYGYGYGYPGYGYGYDNGYGSGYGYPATGASGYYSSAAPLVTGRSVATGQMGRMCSTPVKACELYQASWVGNGCSCRVSGGRARGSVTP
jgi:hypothetical protein